VVVLADGNIGQVMEPVEFASRAVPPPPEWAVRGTAETRHNLLTSLYLEPDLMERTCLSWKPSTSGPSAKRSAPNAGAPTTPMFVLVGYGIVGRVLKAVVELARARGHGRGTASPHYLVSVPRGPDSRTQPPGEGVRGGGTQHRAIGGRRAPGAWRAAARWSSTAAWAATSLGRGGAGLRGAEVSSRAPVEEVLIHG
jgi:hypothetical protein